MKQTTYICDRCGKKKIRTKETPNEVTINVRKVQVEHAAWISIHSKTGYEIATDLCQECLESLRDWFGNNQSED